MRLGLWIALCLCVGVGPVQAERLNNVRMRALSYVYGTDFTDKLYACLYEGLREGLPLQMVVEACRYELGGATSNSAALERTGNAATNVLGGVPKHTTIPVTSKMIRDTCKGANPRLSLSSSLASGVREAVAGAVNGGASKPPAKAGDGSAKDAKTGDASKPDASKPDAGKPGASKPDAGKPDAGKPDAGKPDAGKPDAGKPDAGKPDAVKPDAGKPGAGKPDGGVPDAGTWTYGKEVDVRAIQVLEILYQARGNAIEQEYEDMSQYTVQDSSCEDRLAEAEEFVRQCRLKGFKSNPDCARLTGNCTPDLILVDPEQGYVCAPHVDAKAVKKAWTTGCNSTVTPGPNGQSPCNKVDIQGGTLLISDSAQDICKPGNPLAYIDPGSDICLAKIGKPKLPTVPNGPTTALVGVSFSQLGGPMVIVPVNVPPVAIPF
jgi:hypothetical protein